MIYTFFCSELRSWVSGLKMVSSCIIDGTLCQIHSVEMGPFTWNPFLDWNYYGWQLVISDFDIGWMLRIFLKLGPWLGMFPSSQNWTRCTLTPWTLLLPVDVFSGRVLLFEKCASGCCIALLLILLKDLTKEKDSHSSFDSSLASSHSLFLFGWVSNIAKGQVKQAEKINIWSKRIK